MPSGSYNYGHVTIHLPVASGGDVTIAYGTDPSALTATQRAAIGALQWFDHNDYANLTGETSANHVVAASEVGQTLVVTSNYSDPLGVHRLDSQAVLIA
jgi:hypothetical protein